MKISLVIPNITALSKTDQKELRPLRKIFILSIGVCFVLLILGVAGIRESKADNSSNKSESNTIVQAAPGTRCTRFNYPKKNEEVFFRRCTRLFSKTGKPGSAFPNTPPSVELRASTNSIVVSCKDGATPASCPPDACKLVILSGIAADADRDQVLYTYVTTGGRIKGDGSAVIWDLNAVQPGTYTGTVEVDDGCGCTAFSSTSVAVAACSDCKQ
jgi:hypothetical protein